MKAAAQAALQEEGMPPVQEAPMACNLKKSVRNIAGYQVVARMAFARTPSQQLAVTAVAAVLMSGHSAICSAAAT